MLRPAGCAVMIVAAVLFLTAPLHCQRWEKIVIDSMMVTPVMPRVADIDGDGDQDVVVSDWSIARVYWFENAGNNVRWTRHLINAGHLSAMGVGIADFDGDVKPDIAVAGYYSIALACYRNDLPVGDWPQDILAYREENADGASWVDVGDIDGDGAVDILMSVHLDNLLTWYQNAGGTPVSWWRRPIEKANGIGGGQISLCDMDEDGDLDIVAAMRNENKLVWLESRRQGSEWTEHVIDRWLPGARAVTVGDIDYDGDLDVVAGGDSTSNQPVVRYEQVGHGAIAWIKSILDSTLKVPGRVEMLEIDGGPTKEVVATSYNEGIVTWYRKVNQTWHREFIDSDLKSARGSCTADINGDGIDELIVAAQEGSGKLVYYRNLDLLPHISYTPATLDFGNVMIDDTGRMPLTITNSGHGVLTIEPLEIMGSGAAAFSIDDPGPYRLAAGKHISPRISCAPTQQGVTKATLRIRSNDAYASPLYINLIVDGVTDRIPRVSCSPALLDFGDVKIGSTAHMTFEITNIGTGRLFIDSLQIDGTGPVPFTITDPASFSLDVRRTAGREIRCTPTVVGMLEETLRIRSSDPNHAALSVPVRVNGVRGLDPHISLDATTVHFGTVTVGSTAQKDLAVTNIGDAPLRIERLEVLGFGSCPFRLEDPSSFRLDPGDTEYRIITCTPDSAGIARVSLHIACNDASCPHLYVDLIVDGITDVADAPRPHGIRLEQNFPNPFNPATEIRYALPSFGTVQLSVHDLLGRRIATLVNDAQSGGTHRVVFDAAGLPPGIYVCRLRWNGRSVSRTMTLLK